jgi:hypothetical protein
VPRSKNKKKKQEEHRLTLQEVVVKKVHAKNAVVTVSIDDDSIFTIIFRKDGDELYIECSEDANPDTAITNSYPEYFDDDK